MLNQTAIIILLAAILALLAINLVVLAIIYQRQKGREFLQHLEEQLGNFDQKLEERNRLSDRLMQDNISQLQNQLLSKNHEQAQAQQKALYQFKEEIEKGFSQHRENFDKRQMESLQTLQSSLHKGLELNSQRVQQEVSKLTEQTQTSLNQINQQVEKRLNEGFAKTTETFNDVMKRLTVIDQAQQKITELSSNVVSLQDILVDKRSRGAFGEIQLSNLLDNMLSESDYALQYTLDNNTRVDCLLFLPQPTGNIAIDAKFPLENYQNMTQRDIEQQTQAYYARQFKQDVKSHIKTIADKYIIPGKTGDGAIMFIPAEAVFAEIHSRYPELVEYAHQAQVWLASPTTMMAILTTARSVIRNDATRQQINIIREHLSKLSQDFNRFQERMDKLAKHIEQAHNDTKDVNTSARKITSHFQKIEKVDLPKEQTDQPIPDNNNDQQLPKN